MIKLSLYSKTDFIFYWTKKGKQNKSNRGSVAKVLWATAI